MEEHKLLDILINFRTLIISSEKIKKLDPTISFTDDILVKKQVCLHKLLSLLNEIEPKLETDEIDRESNQPDELNNKLNSMANLFGGEQIVESSDINPAIFDNFGSGLARLLGGVKLTDTQQQQQQMQIQLPINQNFSFNLKKKTNPLL